MAIVEDQAVVLRSLRHGETSRIATLLTRRYGKVHVMAKGARDIKAPFGAALEPLTRVEVVLYLKPSRSLQFLRAAATVADDASILTDTAGYCVAVAGLEFVDRVLTDEDPAAGVFDALVRFLEGCRRRPDHPRAELRLRAFQLHTVSLLGYAPQMLQCAGCGRPLDPPAGFGLAEGGLVCRECAASARPVALSAPAVALLREIVLRAQGDREAGSGALGARHRGTGIADAPGPPRPVRTPRGVDAEVIQTIELFLRYHVTGYRGLRSLTCLDAWRALRGGPGGRDLLVGDTPDRP